jgi:hypothetical protein
VQPWHVSLIGVAVVFLVGLVAVLVTKASDDQMAEPRSTVAAPKTTPTDSLAPSAAAKIGSSGPPPDYSALVAGINRIATTGTSGVLTTDKAWVPIAVGGSNAYWNIENEHRRPAVVVAARQLDAGRIVAASQNFICSPGGPSTFDNERFGDNAIRWLDNRSTKTICLRQTRWSPGVESGLVDRLVFRQGYRKRVVPQGSPLTIASLTGCGVLIYVAQWDKTSPTETDAVESFVRQGGGLYCEGTGWSFQQYIDMNLDHFPMNELGSRFGVRFDGGNVEDPTRRGGAPWEPVIKSF